MIPGVAITMGGREWVVPPLTLGQLRRLLPKVRQLSEIGTQMGETQIGVLVEIVAAALQRNYPEIAAEAVESLLDLGNATMVLNAVLMGSGLTPTASPPGEAAAPGRMPGACGATSETIGGTSMGSSRQPADTAIPSSTQ